MRRKLKALSASQLAQWLQLQTMTPCGANILCGHLIRLFGPGPTTDSALAVLRSPAANVARGVVRADLYYNWRCASRDSNPKDLVDDMYHVLNSTYCDVYATGDRKQAEYAGLLLTANTKIAVYDGQTRVDRWLEGLV